MKHFVQCSVKTSRLSRMTRRSALFLHLGHYRKIHNAGILSRVIFSMRCFVSAVFPLWYFDSMMFCLLAFYPVVFCLLVFFLTPLGLCINYTMKMGLVSLLNSSRCSRICRIAKIWSPRFGRFQHYVII